MTTVLGLLLLATLLVVAGSAPAQAQSGFDVAAQNPAEGPSIYGDVRSKGGSMRIYMSGSLQLSLVNRNSDYFTAALAGGALGANTAGPAGGTGGDVVFDPQLRLNLEFQIKDNVSGVVELQTPFNARTSTGGTNTTVAGRTRRTVDLEQIYVKWDDAFAVEDLSLKVGIQEFKKDFSGQGNFFLVDVTRSESPFNNPSAAADTGQPQAASAGLIQTQEAAGMLTRYSMDYTHLDIFYLTLNETFRKNSDDVMFGATLEHTYDAEGDSQGQVGAAIMVLQNDADSYLFTVGLGGNMKWNSGLEVYGEGYAQGGQYANNGTATGNDIKQQDAFAIFGGVRYTLLQFEDTRPYFGASYWEVSGDDEAGDGRNENFVSLENNNDTLVVENGWWGLDIDTNYRALKFETGFHFNDPWTEGKGWDFEALFAYFELQDNNGAADGSARSRDKIGDELDLSLTYHATEFLSFRLATGWLFDSSALGQRQDTNVTIFETSLDF